MFSDILLGTTSATTVVPATCCVRATTCTTTSISGATSPNRSPAEPGTATEGPASQTHHQQTSHAPQVRVTLHANSFKSRVVQAWRARGIPSLRRTFFSLVPPSHLICHGHWSRTHYTVWFGMCQFGVPKSYHPKKYFCP